MSHLLADLLREPPLERDRELALARAARAGDEVARRLLVRSSLRLVALRVRALGVPPGDVDDAVQDGALALIAAVGRFDPDRGVRLATFAWPRIGGALLRRWESARGAVPCVPEELPVVVDERVDVAAAASVDSLLGVLADDENEVVRMRHGLPPWSAPCPWERVADHLEVSVSAARRIGVRAMSRLRSEVGTVGDRAPDHRESVPRSSIGRAFDC